MQRHYIITVQGHLDQGWSGWFDGLTITNRANGQGVLAGLISDQAALHGVLIKIRDLGLPLLSLQALPKDDANLHVLTSVEAAKTMSPDAVEPSQMTTAF